MFDRASNAALVCWRCQIRVAPRHTPKGPNAIPRGPQALRWQSAVAARTQDDDQYYEDVGSVRQDREPDDQTKVADLTERKRKPNRRVKTLWKPDRTAKLGVDALGTPSEVLLLPTRDRQIPAVPQEEDISPKEHVYASLSSEKEPVQWEHVKENISNVRSRIETDRTSVKAEEWSKLVDGLKQGFSQAQLRQYLQESPSISKSRSRVFDYKKQFPKGLIAALIIKEAWGYKSSHTSSPSEDNNRHDPEIEVTLPMKNEQTLSTMQRDPTNALKEIQQTLGITISSSVKEDQWFLTLKGPQRRVKQARLAVLTLHKNVKSTLLTLKNCLRHLRQQGSPDAIKALVRTLSTKYGVEIVLLKNSLRVMATKQNRAAIEHIKRDLLLALDFSHKRAAWRALASRPDQLVLVPTHTTSSGPWPRAKYNWRRCLEPTPGFARSDSSRKHEEFNALRAKVLHGLQDALGHTTSPASVANGRRVTHSATFGSVLFHQAQDEQLALLKAQSSPRSRFSATVPLVPQLLSHQKMQLRPEQSQEAGGHTKGQQVRLLLRPAAPENFAPDIEVDVSLPNNASASESVVIRSVSIAHDKTEFYALLPCSVVDVKFARELRRDIFRLDSGFRVSEGGTQILRSLEVYLKDVSLTKLQKGDVGCFLTLPMAVDLRTSSEEIVDQPRKFGHKKQKEKPTPVQERAPETDLAAESAESDSESPGTAVGSGPVPQEEYVLASCEMIDVDSRMMPQASGKSRWRLDHTTYHGGKLGPDSQQLQLRATQKSLDDESEQSTLASLFDTALNVANRLDDAGRQLKHRISNMK